MVDWNDERFIVLPMSGSDADKNDLHVRGIITRVERKNHGAPVEEVTVTFSRAKVKCVPIEYGGDAADDTFV